MLNTTMRVTVTVPVPMTVAMAMIVAVVVISVAVAMVAQNKEVERIDSYTHQSQCKHHCRMQMHTVKIKIVSSSFLAL